MIKVMRINSKELVVNAELIEFMEATPDTVISLTTGRKLVVADPIDAVIKKVLEYKRSVNSPVIVEKG